MDAKRTLCLALFAGSLAAGEVRSGTAEAGEVVCTDSFGDSRRWSVDPAPGDTGSGEARTRCSRKVDDGCLILGTSNTGATFLNPVPHDLVLETHVKVAAVKSGPNDPDPRNPGAHLFLRKRENGDLWSCYAIRLWFRQAPTIGHVLIRKYEFDLRKGRAVLEETLLERRWLLEMDTWYVVRAAAVGNQITVWIDGEEIGTATDDDGSYAEGDVALSGCSWPSYAFFREFRILEPE